MGRRTAANVATPAASRCCLMLLSLLCWAGLAASREVHRNKDDVRRMRLTREKVQHVERAVRYADYGDGYARLEQLDLYDAGAKLVSDLIVEQYPDLVELELDDNRISDASAEALGAAIRASTELRTLHLDGNDLTADAVPHLIEPLCGGKLRALHFNDNMLGCHFALK